MPELLNTGLGPVSSTAGATAPEPRSKGREPKGAQKRAGREAVKNRPPNELTTTKDQAEDTLDASDLAPHELDSFA